MFSRIAAAVLVLLFAAPAVAGQKRFDADLGHHDNRHYKYGSDHKRHGGAWIGHDSRHGGAMHGGAMHGGAVHGGAVHGGHFGAGHGHFSPRGQGGHHWGW